MAKLTKVDEGMVQHWQSLAAQLRSLRKQEMALRQQITNAYMKPAEVGTKHAQVGPLELTISVSESLSLDEKMLLSLMLTGEEKACVEWKPKLLKRSYDKLPVESVLRTAVTIKHGAPTLKVESVEEV